MLVKIGLSLQRKVDKQIRGGVKWTTNRNISSLFGSRSKFPFRIMGRLSTIQRRVYPFLIFFCFPICVVERRMVMDQFRTPFPHLLLWRQQDYRVEENTPSKT